MTKTHVPDEILLVYAAGHLEPGYAVIAATHVQSCETCAQKLARLTAAGGDALEAAQPAVMSASAADVMAMAKSEDAKTVAPDRFGNTLLSGLVGDDLNVLPYKKMAKGIRQHIIEIDGKASLRLLWIEPGKAVPAHGHGGLEMTQTLVGGYFVGDEAYTAGDVQCVNHETVAVSDFETVAAHLLPPELCKARLSWRSVDAAFRD